MHNKFDRQEINVNFLDIFHLKENIKLMLSDLETKEMLPVLHYSGLKYFYDKQFIGILVQCLLKNLEEMDFEELIKIGYLSSELNIKSEAFWKKLIDCLNMNIIVLVNYMEGNKQLENLEGLYEKKYIEVLKKQFSPKIEKVYLKIRNLEKTNEQDHLNYISNIIIKTVFLPVYYRCSQVDHVSHITDISNQVIKLFNDVTSMISPKSEIFILQSIKKALELSFIYFNLMNNNRIKLNINLDFLEKVKTKNDIDQNENLLKFQSKISLIFDSNEEYLKLSNDNNNKEQDISLLLHPDYIRKRQYSNITGKPEKVFIFINSPLLYSHLPEERSFFKIEKEICKKLNIKPIYLDYKEVFIFK